MEVGTKAVFSISQYKMGLCECVGFFFFFCSKKAHPAPAIGIIICYYYYFLSIDFSPTLVSKYFQHPVLGLCFSASPLYSCVILCQLFYESC